MNQTYFLLALLLTRAVTLVGAAEPVPGREISPQLVATNLWYGDPADKVWELTRDAHVSLIRIGGHAYDVLPPGRKRWRTGFAKFELMVLNP